jgi:hypothetical protein
MNNSLLDFFLQGCPDPVPPITNEQRKEFDIMCEKLVTDEIDKEIIGELFKKLFKKYKEDKGIS